MSKVSWRGGALLAPVPPVMVTCKFKDTTNILTIGWTGIINTIPPKTYISVRPSRFSYNLIKNQGEFVINLTTKSLVKAADFCGVKSGENLDKAKLLNLEYEDASKVNVPLLKQSPVNLECKVSQIIKLGSHDMFLADIVAVDIDENYIDKDGKLHLDKCNLVAYSHGEYFALGEKLGRFGYSVKKKKSKRNK